MRRHFVAVALTLFFCGNAGAACVGRWDAYTCYDHWGNSYNIQRLGNATIMQGNNAYTGGQWSQQIHTFGNVTQIQGETNGNRWNETIIDYGNGFRSRQGTDSQGRRFSILCGPYGCN